MSGWRDDSTLEFGHNGDAAISRTGPGAISVGGGGLGSVGVPIAAGGSIAAASVVLSGNLTAANSTMSGSSQFHDLVEQATTGGQCLHNHLAELVTLSLTSPVSQSAANLLPANAVIKAVAARVNSTITGATSWTLGDGSTADRFLASNTGVNPGATAVGLAQWAGAAMVQAAAAPLDV